MWLRDCISNCIMHNLKELYLFDMASIDDIYWFLHRIPNLESLRLCGCQFNEYVPKESIGVREKIGNVVKLKMLVLVGMHGLQNMGLEHDPFLERLEKLCVVICPELIKLAHSSVSFTRLTKLVVMCSDRIMNLMASSIAKSLVQLTTMTGGFYHMMKEIIADEEKEEETTVEIVFNKLYL